MCILALFRNIWNVYNPLLDTDFIFLKGNFMRFVGKLKKKKQKMEGTMEKRATFSLFVIFSFPVNTSFNGHLYWLNIAR